MKRALRISGVICMAFGLLLGLPFVISGAMLQAQADKKR